MVVGIEVDGFSVRVVFIVVEVVAILVNVVVYIVVVVVGVVVGSANEIYQFKKSSNYTITL